MPRLPGEWADLDMTGSPLLVLGWRPRPRQLEARVVDLQPDAQEVLRQLAVSAIRDLAAMERVLWSPAVHLEPGEEYLALDTTGLLSAPEPRDPDLQDAAGLLRLLLDTPRLEPFSTEDLDGLPFAFYAVVLEQADNGQPAAFVRAWDPTQVLRRASRWFRFSDSLRVVEAPDLAVDARIDLVVTTTEVAALNSLAFERLFADVRRVLVDVPDAVLTLTNSSVKLAFSNETIKAITAFCSSRPSYAKRLRRVSDEPHLAHLSVADFASALNRHGSAANDFINNNNELEFDESRVKEFLDILEGRWFSADFTAERRRADRFRPR